MNGNELLIMIEKKRVAQSDTNKNQRGKMFKHQRCRMKLKQLKNHFIGLQKTA
jgi:hypothetical protein